jgi:hypothetical protein
MGKRRWITLPGSVEPSNLYFSQSFILTNTHWKGSIRLKIHSRIRGNLTIHGLKLWLLPEWVGRFRECLSGRSRGNR